LSVIGFSGRRTGGAQTIRGGKLLANATARGQQLADGLRRMSNRHPLIGDVRGRGLVIGVDLVEDRGTRAPATKACAKVAFRAAELGAAVFYVGHHSNVLELTPPIIISESEVDEGLQIPIGPRRCRGRPHHPGRRPLCGLVIRTFGCFIISMPIRDHAARSDVMEPTEHRRRTTLPPTFSG
jgi:hypothetical protein